MGFQIGDKVIHWTYGLGEIPCSLREDSSTVTPPIVML